MPTPKAYRPWFPDRVLLLPPDMRAWLPEDHLACFLLHVVSQLDITAITDKIQAKDPRGVQRYDPRMMVTLLLYAYCTGRPSSRKIERATYDDVAFRVLADGQHPDHSTISDFRKVHLKALARLVVQVLQLCQAVGLVKLGRVALDGTKGKASASRYKAMSYQRMLKTEAALEAEIQQLLAEAEATDTAEDERYGKDKRGDELPAELRRRQDRLAAIRKARAEVEREAAVTRAKELRQLAAKNRKQAEKADSPGKAAAAERRADKHDEQASELEAKAAGKATPDTTAAPAETTADPPAAGPVTESTEVSQAKEDSNAEGETEDIVEPVFGQMRTCQGFHGFLLRGIEQARGEWSLYCTGHNLLKLFRACKRGVGMPWTPPPAQAIGALASPVS